MPLLIDGYNLLFAAGLTVPPRGSRQLERARLRLLNHLVLHLSPETRRQTVVVFDAKTAPAGAPAEQQHGGMRVLFAQQQAEADDLIEELLRHESVPRRLTVVSSDLRLRVAAQRRGAQSIKSEDWLDQIERARDESSRHSTPLPSHDRGKRQGLNELETNTWLDEFELNPNFEPPDPGADPPPDAPTSPGHSDWSPFPPGYGDDVT